MTERLRIGWFFQDLNPGGGQRVCKEVSKILARRGHIVTIVVPKGRAKNASIEGVKIVEAGVKSANPAMSIVASLPFMYFALGRQDVVISSMPFMGILNALKTNIRLKYHWLQSDDLALFSDRSLIKSEIALKMYFQSVKASYHLPVKYWTNSNWTREKFNRFSDKEVRIVNCGVNQSIFSPGDLSESDEITIGAVGRRVKFKGLEDIVASLNILADKGIKFNLRVFSKDRLELLRTSFKAEIISPPDDYALAEEYRKCSVFVSASWHEGFYLPSLEAMSCGAPIVTTDSGGCREYAVHGENCLMVPPKKPELLAEAIQRMLNDKEMRMRMRKAGIETASKFSWENCVNRIEDNIASDMERK